MRGVKLLKIPSVSRDGLGLGGGEVVAVLRPRRLRSDCYGCLIPDKMPNNCFCSFSGSSR